MRRAGQDRELADRPGRAVPERITQACVDAYGVTPEQVQVFVHESWAKGGTLAADG